MASFLQSTYSMLPKLSALYFSRRGFVNEENQISFDNYADIGFAEF